MAETKSTSDDSIYHIIYLPLVASTPLSIKEQDEIQDYVQTYGYRIFHPEAINAINATITGAKRCTWLYLAFKILILNEHEAGINLAERFWDKAYGEAWVPSEEKKRRKDYNKIATSGKTKLSDIIEAKAVACQDTAKGIIQLMTDLYAGRDNDNLFGNTSSDFASILNIPTPEDEYNAFSTTSSTKGEIKEIKDITDNKDNKDIQLLYDIYALTELGSRLRPTNKNSVAVILLDRNYEYVGHVYVWPSKEVAETLDIVGIRTSLPNLYCKSIKGIGQKLIMAAVKYAVDNNFVIARIVHPLEVMRNILPTIGWFNNQTISPYINAAKITSYWWSPGLSDTTPIGRPGYPHNMPTSVLDFVCRFPFREMSMVSEETKEVRKRLDKLFESNEMCSNKADMSECTDKLLTYWLRNHPSKWIDPSTLAIYKRLGIGIAWDNYKSYKRHRDYNI